MTGQSQQSSTAANLDLAPIGNGRIAALVDTSGRIVWWCFPRFDSDPVFSRLLAGDEEKGFCDVVLEGQVASEAAYLRNTAIVETMLRGRQRQRACASPTSRRASSASSASSIPPQIFRRIEPVRGPAAHQDPGAADLQLRRSPAPPGRSAPTTSATPAAPTRCALTTDAPLSYIAHETPFALITAGHADPRARRAVRGRGRHGLARVPRAHARLLARLGALARRSRSNSRPRSSARPSR